MERKSTKPVVKLWLDSGAYSAHAKGESIHLGDYIAYVKRHEHLLHAYFNLDVIPGQWGIKRTPAGVEQAAAQSRENFLTIRKAYVEVVEGGNRSCQHRWRENRYSIESCTQCTAVLSRKYLRPIPVFHQGEDWKWLDKMLSDVRKDTNPYIALSTWKELSVKENRDWLDKCFTKLVNKDGFTNPLWVHGLGIASFELLKRYPWYTCDATSWALTAAYGSIYVPAYRNGKFDYSEDPAKLTVSEAERKLGSLPNDHYLRMGPMCKERVEKFLTDEVGVSVKDAAHDYEVRARAIVFFFLKFQEAIGDRPFRHNRRGFM